MRLSLPFLLLLCLPWLGKSQFIVQEHFDSGSWQSQAWKGDMQLFAFESNQLRLKDSVAGTASLVHPCPALVPARYDIHGQMDFNPSSSNYLEVLVHQDESYPKAPNFGYSLQIGGNSQDALRFYRMDTGELKLLMQSPPNWLQGDLVDFHISLRRTATGTWQIWADTGLFQQWNLLAQSADSNHRFSLEYGLKLHYTQTRSDRFYLDSLSLKGTEWRDTISPKIDSLSLRAQSLQLYFDEKLAPPDSTCRLSSTALLPAIRWEWNPKRPKNLTWKWDLALQPNERYNFLLEGIKDRFANPIQSDSLSLMLREVGAGELRFNEIMSDPSPKVFLSPSVFPEVEFIELKNISELALNTQGMLLEIGDDQYRLDPYDLDAQSFLVLASRSSEGLWPASVPVLYIDWPTYALSNEGQGISLFSAKGLLLDQLTFSKDWQEPLKAEGGWSLERVDLSCACANALNWKSSIHPHGASPGLANSRAGPYEDSTWGQLLFYEIPSLDSLVLHFDRSLGPIDRLQLRPDLGIDTLIHEGYNWLLRLQNQIQNEELYWLKFSDSLSDCAQRAVKLDSVPFGLAGSPKLGDIRISEILINPYDEGSDFVEIYNLTTSYFDLAQLRLGIWEEGIVAPMILSEEHRVLQPGALLALSPDLDHLKRQYDAPASALQKVTLPSMPDAGVSLALCRSDLSLIDRVAVEEEFHHPFIGDPEGVSLYRLDFSDFATASHQWESSPRNQGYATPGRWYLSERTWKKEIWQAEPEYISPNGDGYHDFLNFKYALEEGAWIKADLFNQYGKWIKSLCKGEFRSERGSFSWKGRDAAGQICPAGIYVAVLEYQYPEGHRGFERCAVVLSQ